MRRSIVCFLFFFTYSSLLFASDWFINPSTVGLNNGTSWSNGWICFADINWNLIHPGDDIYLSGGTTGILYNEDFNFNASGTEGNRILVKPGASHPTLSYGHDGLVTIGGVFECKSNQFIGIDGHWRDFPVVHTWQEARNLNENDYKIKISNADGVGIHYKYSNNYFGYVEVGNNGVLTDSHHGIYSNPNSGTEPVGTIIEYCFIHDNAGDGINNTRSNTNSSLNLLIRYCHFSSNDVDGIQAAGGITLQHSFMDGSGNVPGSHADGIQGAGSHWSITGNVFMNWPQSIFIESSGGSQGLDEIHVLNNTFWNTNGNYQLMIAIAAKYTSADVVVTGNGIKIANNTVDSLVDRNFIKFAEKPIAPSGSGIFTIINSYIINNIFYDAPSNWVAINIENLDISSDQDLLIQNNNIYNNQKIAYDGILYQTLEDLTSAHSDFTGNTDQQPLFVDRGLHFYQLQSEDMAALNGGLSLSEFDGDALNVSRPQGSAWDIGAYEYVSLMNQPPVISSISTQTKHEGELVQFDITVIDADAVDTITLNVQGQPQGLALTKTADRQWHFAWQTNFNANNNSPYTLTFIANDGTIDSNPVSVELIISNVDTKINLTNKTTWFKEGNI